MSQQFLGIGTVEKIRANSFDLLEVRRKDELTVCLYWHCGEDMSE